MWKTKSSKKESPNSGLICIVSDHDEPELIQVLEAGGNFISIDPAQQNYTVRIEYRPSKESRRRKIMVKAFIRANILKMAEQDNCFITLSLSKFLDQFNFNDSPLAIIERQVVENYKSTWLAHHTYAYFQFKFPHIIVTEVASIMKTQILKAPAHLNKSGIKIWSVENALKLSKMRKDRISIEYIEEDAKADDKADTINQLEAVCVYYSRGGYDVLTTRDIYD